MELDKALLDDLIRRILSVASPTRIVLFGSASRGEMRLDSDLDILVVVPNGSNHRDIAKRIYRNLIGFSLAVDIVVATEDDLSKYGDNYSLVYYSALHEGKEIYAA